MNSNINNTTDIIDEDKMDFLNRVFIRRIYPDDTTPHIKRNLSGLSYRLAWLLAQKLEFYEPHKLPPIKEMAEVLDTTTASIHNALAQLETAAIIIRSTEESVLIVEGLDGDGTKQEERDKKFSEYVKKEINSKSFKDFFCLNFYCNMSYDERASYWAKYLVELMLKPPKVFSFLAEDHKEKIYEEIVNLKMFPDDFKGSKEKTREYIEALIKYYQNT